MTDTVIVAAIAGGASVMATAITGMVNLVSGRSTRRELMDELGLIRRTIEWHHQRIERLERP